MTSGVSKTVPVSSVWVDRAKRQRDELVGIEELADSISRVGLIHFPVIRRSGELVVGERRFEAVKLLGWTDLPIQYIEDLPEDELRAVELEENVRRVDLPWQRQCLAVEEYHTLKEKADPTWNSTKTAEALGLSSAEVTRKRDVAAELLNNNVRVVNAPKYSTARNIVGRDKERKRDSVIAKLEGKPKEEVPLLNEDFHEWVNTYAGPPFNLIHCDFPYGINADHHDQGSAPELGGYKDSFENYQGLIGSLRTASERNIVADSAHLIFWFSMDHYLFTILELENMGWQVSKFPLIWHKNDNSGILPDPQRGPRRLYETAFFASRGDRKIVHSVGNIFSHPVVKDHHMSEKPLPMLTHFLRMVTDEYSSLFDPTAGSGNALIAGRKLGASAVLGLEKEREFYDRACENWRKQIATGDEGG